MAWLLPCLLFAPGAAIFVGGYVLPLLRGDDED